MISILFVDDNNDLCAQIRMFLEKTGDIRVDTARSIKNAMEKALARPYDVIISYDETPDVNGIEFVADTTGIDFIRYLKSHGNTTPVILLSRRGSSTVQAQEIANAIQIPVPKSGDVRPRLDEIVMLIKQAMLKRKAERELRLQNEQLTTILESTPLGAFHVRNGIVEWANRQFCDMLGFSDSQVAGIEVRSLFKSDEEYEHVFREFQLKLDAHGAGITDCALIRRDGTSLPCVLQVRTDESRNASRSGVFIVTDNTEKQHLADALKASEGKYREVIQNTQSIIIRMDMQGTITFLNSYALAFFDYAPDEIVGKNVVGTIVPEKNRSGHGLSIMANDLGFNAEGYAVNVSENVRRNGDRVWIAWINKAIRDEQGGILEILCIGNDITDRKRASGEIRISMDSWKDTVVANTDIREDVFDAAFHICTEISLEGREGKAVGTTFLIGDAKNVMAKSRQIMLNAFEGHLPELRLVTNPDLKENIKEFAQLDGAFVITGDGFIEASGRYITVDTSKVTLPRGMGTRHNSVAAITQESNAIGIVVSQSGGGITVFKNGQILKKVTL